MKNSTIKALTAATLVLGFALTPTAHAQPRPETGVGPVIAAQGNLALELIKAEVKLTIQSWLPSTAKVRVRRDATATRAPTADAAGVGLADTARCAP